MNKALRKWQYNITDETVFLKKLKKI